MAFAEDLAPFYADFGEAVTVNGIAVVGIFDRATGDTFGLVPNATSFLRVPVSVAAAVGQTVVRGAVTYTITSIDYADGSGAERLLGLK